MCMSTPNGKLNFSGNPSGNNIYKSIGQFANQAPSGMAAPVNPMGVAMAGKAASVAGATPFQSKPTKIADSFLGTTDAAAQKTQSGYKVVG